MAPGSKETKQKVAGGCRGVKSGVYEYEVNLNVGLLLRDLLQEAGATVVMTHEVLDVNISNSQRAQMFNEAKVDLGIRPSDFELAKEGANAIPAHVESIEPLGDAYLIYVRIGEKVVVYKYAGEKAPSEKDLLLAPNLAKLHLFDPETEKRINA